VGSQNDQTPTNSGECLMRSVIYSKSCRLAAVILLIFGGASAGRGAVTERHRVPGHVPAVVSELGSLGRLPNTNRLYLCLGLPLHHQSELNALLRQIYDSHSTNYHHYLRPPEFTARFGPTEQDYEAVVKFAEASGLTIAHRHSNRLVLDVQGRVADVEKAFYVTLHTYRHPAESRNFFAPDVDPSVPVNVPVADMWGLSDYALPEPMLKTIDPPAFPLDSNGSGPGGSYQGTDFRNAYAPGTSLVGSGQTAAVLEFDSYYTNDITAYEGRIGSTNNVPLQNVLVDGVSGLPGYLGIPNGVAEVSLDIETTIAMAPGLSKFMVYEGLYGYDILNQMATDDEAQQISSSWRWLVGPGFEWNAATNSTLDAVFEEMDVQGQSFFQASADTDAYTGAQAVNSSTGPIPVDSIYLTSVGGTTLTMNGSGTNWSSETTWNEGNNFGSGGGISTNYTIPWWQTNISMAANGGSALYRNFPDVALTAESVGFIWNNGEDGTSAGTSSAAPLWAGFCALANQQAAALGGGTNTVGFLNPALYAISATAGYAACFHDITTGNNIGNNTPGQFYATNGYDLCTGLGTPNGTNLINSLAPLPVPYFIAQPVSQGAPRGGCLVLSVDAVGQAPLAFQWLFDGAPLAAANVAGAPAETLTLTNVTAAEAGDYSVVVTNNNGLITSSAVMVTVTNPPPAANLYAINRTAGLSAHIFWANIATNWSDLDGDTVTLAGINLVTANGVTVLTNGTQILYPASAPNTDDQISYTVSDGAGGTGTGVIDVVVPSPFVTGQQSLAALTVQNGAITASFYGIPAYTYETQRSTNLNAGTGWVTIATNLVGINGLITVTDSFPDLGGNLPVSAYYRLAWQP
jgi:subtilase family serine protease